jgi:thymidine phosphorylase
VFGFSVHRILEPRSVGSPAAGLTLALKEAAGFEVRHGRQHSIEVQTSAKVLAWNTAANLAETDPHTISVEPYCSAHQVQHHLQFRA